MKTTYTWTAIIVVVIMSTAGDVLLAHSMQKIGDLEALRARRGLLAVISRVLGTPMFVLAVCFMAMSFFSLLIALSWADVSLVAPASASLTFITNAIAAKFLLKENVDHRRWIAVLFVAAGVAFLAK